LKRFLEISLVVVKLLAIVLFFEVIVSLGAIALIYTFDYIRVKTFVPPERLSNIPEGAIWKGGPDGGDWFYIIGKHDSVYKIEIYNDYNGESHNKVLLNNENDYVICQECKGQIDTVSNILPHISYSGVDKIYLNINDKNNKPCYLELVSLQKEKINKSK
jgi:hypothetical protein